MLFLLNAETELQNVDSYKLFKSGLFYKEHAGDQLGFCFGGLFFFYFY